MLFDGFDAAARGERRAVFLPGVADQAQAPVANRLIGGSSGGDGEPAFVLFDAERALVKTIGDRRTGAEIVAVPSGTSARARVGAAARRARREIGMTSGYRCQASG